MRPPPPMRPIVLPHTHVPSRCDDCDPGKIDNVYGRKTDTATENFLRATLTTPPESEQVDGILKKIRATHKWPAEAWRPVFDLYMEVLADFLQVKPSEMPGLAATLKFVDDDKKILACGESFPTMKAATQHALTHTAS